MRVWSPVGKTGVFGSVQDVGHLVDDTLLLVDNPSCCEDGSTHEDLPGVCLVTDLDPLGVSDVHDGVVTDDVTAPDGVDSDFLSAGADSLASVGVLPSAELLADDLGRCDCGTAGGILLLVVVGLEDLDVVVLSEVPGGVPDELEEHADSDGVVG